MPRSIFLGRAMPAPGEPLWLDEDRDWALALAHVEADVCPDCRQPWGEVSAKENEFAYRAHVARCHSCAAASRAMRNFEDSGGQPGGLHVHVEKHEPKVR